MAISVNCAQCNKSYQVRDEQAGKRVKCPQGHAITVPGGKEVFTFAEQPEKPKEAKPVVPLLKTCENCGGDMAVKDVICLECGFDARSGRTLATKRTGGGVSRNVLIFGGLGASILAATVVLIVLLANRGSKEEPTPNLVPTVQGGKQVPPPVIPPNPNPNPGAPPIPPPVEPEFDLNSKLTIADLKATVHGKQVLIEARCTWSGKPNPKMYSVGKYSFTPVVKEITINGLPLKFDKPDLRTGPVEYSESHTRASFLINPGLPLDHLAASAGELAVRIGDSAELQISQSSVAKGEPLPKKAETPTPAAEWEALRGTWSDGNNFQLKFEGETCAMVVDKIPIVVLTVKLDTNRTPKAADFVSVIKGVSNTVEYIYKIEGDRLTMAMAGFPGGGRPDSFEPSPYVVVSTYRRVAANPMTPVEPTPASGGLPKGELAFHSDRDGTMEIYRMEIGGGVKQLTKGGGANPAWSPDGKKIAYDVMLKGRTVVFIMDAEGNSHLILKGAEGRKPTWSPDGEHIVFEGPFSLMRIPATGGTAKPVTPGIWNDDDPVWTSDGKIVFSSPMAGGFDVKKGKGAIEIKGGSNRQLFSVPAEGGAPAPITPDAARQFCQPAVSPDGKRIAAVALPPGNVIDAYEDIWLMTREGKDPLNLTNSPKGYNHAPDWSPDGKWLVFSSKRDGNFELYAMPVDGGAAQRLTNHPGNDSAPRWRPKPP